MSDMLQRTQQLIGDVERVEYAFFANEGSGGGWVYSRWIDFVYLVGPFLKAMVARPRVVAVTDRSIVLMRGGHIPRTWSHPQDILATMPRSTPIQGELKGKSSYITIGSHRLWVRNEVYPYVESARGQLRPA